jgi:GNAT superfamily N-acetyltransferase
MMAFAHEYRIEIFVGTQMEKIIPFWAHQVLTVFREYPYLYDGTTDEGIAYCKEVMGYKDAAIAVAYRDEKPVGFLSGASFVNFEDHFGNTTGFKAADLDAATFYYFAEVIVLPEYRGQGLSKQLFQRLEAWAVNRGYTNGCFISESHEVHPLKPRNYKENDALWRSLEYEKSNISVTYNWNTIQPDGSSRKQDHIIPYWMKQLRQ